MSKVGLGPQDDPTWEQSRIQNPSRIEVKRDRNQDASLVGFGPLWERFFGWIP